MTSENSKSKDHRSTMKWGLIAGVVLLSVTFVSVVFYKKKQSAYEYISPKRGTIVDAIYGLGKVKSYKQYDIKAGIIKTVEKIYVKEGDEVKKGDLLIKFYDTPSFRSPIDGTVTLVAVDETETVPPQAAVLTVQDLQNKYIEVSLEQQGALRVRQGQRADILFESIRGEKLSGTVDSVFPKQDEFLAHITVESLKRNVLPGMTADVSIIVGRHEDALLVPLSAVNEGVVHIKRDGKKKKVQVRVGGIDGQWAEISEGDIEDSDLVLAKVD